MGKAKSRGFTLIELLVVVIIISTLASISAPTYFKVIERFRLAEVMTNMAAIRNAENEALIRKGKLIDNFDDLLVEVKDKDGNICSGKVCELKYFKIWIKIVGSDRYFIVAQRKPNPPPPKRYAPNYIFYFDSRKNNFGCTDKSCVSDFVN